VKWQDLKDFFKPCGTVVRADVMEEPGGRSKGCGKHQSEYLIDRLVGRSLL
jgi:RNA recognition motif. (a.k.a. RRM, RBD, or RNP domain)